MRVRRILMLTALVSSILGGLAVYLVLSVPNDLKAGALLKQGRAHIAAGRTAQAHDALTEVVQRYPRTDAAAAATVALMKLEEQERRRIRNDLIALQKQQEMQAKAVADLRRSVEGVRTAQATAAAAPAKPPVAKKAPAKRTTAKKRPTKKRAPAKRRKR